MTMASWHWIVLGVALAIAETLLPGTILLWLGISAALVGIIMLAWPDITWQTQVLMFGVIAVVAVAVGLMLRKRLHKPQPREVNLGVQRFVGQRGALSTAIANGRGEIRLGDTVWPVAGPDLPAGTSVVVTGSDGVTLTVRAADQPAG
jgi:membrane protein implicated in regulation of membrane protease activity